MKVFISPHDDDQVLFGAFTLLREKPLVVVVFDSYVQEARGLRASTWERARESSAAANFLGLSEPLRAGLRDDTTYSHAWVRDAVGRALDDWLYIGQEVEYYTPALEKGGHPQHNLVAEAFGMVPNVTRYLTYTTAGKSTHGREVPIEKAGWISRKLHALAAFESQFSLDPRMGCWPHFLRDQREYYL